MNSKWKRTLVAICLASGLLQAPAANAQAEALLGLGARFLPILLPYALATIPMIPALVKQCVPPIPRPHLGWKKKRPAGEADPPQTEGASTTGDTAPQETTAAATPFDPTQKNSNDTVQQAQDASSPGEVATVQPQPRATDNSEWFMDDERVERRPTTTQKIVSQPPRKIEQPRATAQVKGEVLGPPEAALPALPSGTTSAKTMQPAPQTEQPGSPLIMIRVPD